MIDHKSATIAQQRFDAIALAVFALGALVLAIQGVYGTVSYLVEHRRREFGVRIVVGATTGDVGRLVMRDAAGVALVGLGLGSIAASRPRDIAPPLAYTARRVSGARRRPHHRRNGGRADRASLDRRPRRR